MCTHSFCSNLGVCIVLQWLGQMELANRPYSNLLLVSYNQALEQFSVQQRYLILVSLAFSYCNFTNFNSDSSASMCRIIFASQLYFCGYLHSLPAGTFQILIHISACSTKFLSEGFTLLYYSWQNGTGS